jgi:replicative DNA helicase
MAQVIADIRERAQSARPRLDRVPPHDLQAEESLLGAMLLSRDAIAAAVELCKTGDFYRPAHGHIFDAICSLYAQGEPADPVTVADELKRADLLEAAGGTGNLIALQANTPAIANAARYARIVEEHALLRRLITVAGEIAEMGYSLPEDVVATMDRAEAMVFEVVERRVTDSLKPLRELLAASLDHLEALYNRGDTITGVPTGYADLDERRSSAVDGQDVLRSGDRCSRCDRKELAGAVFLARDEPSRAHPEVAVLRGTGRLVAHAQWQAP